MTTIEFYVLTDNSIEQRMNLTCRLVEKALQRRQKLFINTPDESVTEQLDEMLWCFKSESFIPHHWVRTGDASFNDESVLLGHNHEPDGSRPVLINLASKIPFFFSRFERMLEIINEDNEVKQNGRVRWNFYKNRGYRLKHHSITLT